MKSKKRPCNIMVSTGKFSTDQFTGKRSEIMRPCGKPGTLVKTASGHWWNCGGHNDVR